MIAPTDDRQHRARLLVTGATGYIGGRLVPRLLAEGYRVRCLVRDPARLQPELAERCQVVTGSVDAADDLARALEDVDEAYYLVHAMRDTDADFARRDREQAACFAAACHRTGVRRIIYLGGLGDPAAELSPHLTSRQEVGRTLAESGVPVLEFRAAIIVGSGSASFEMLRHLAERLPVMVTPRWVRTRCQPIGVRTVLAYLVKALDRPSASGIYEIGGTDVLTYADMLRIYAEIRGLRRVLIPVPVLTPKLSSWWVHLVTPIPRGIAGPLVEGLRNEVVVRDPERAARTFGVAPMAYREMVRRAIDREATGDLESAWYSSLSSLSDRTPEHLSFASFEGLLVEKHARWVPVSAERGFRSCCRIGGRHGWPGGSGLWRVRAQIDRLLGGVGLRRGRRDHASLRVGDPVDFWRVQHLHRGEAGGTLILHAEMRLPGKGWLLLAARPAGRGCNITATAFFAPRGLGGLLYWLATKPLHRLVFPSLTAGLARSALRAVSHDQRS